MRDLKIRQLQFLSDPSGAVVIEYVRAVDEKPNGVITNHTVFIPASEEFTFLIEQLRGAALDVLVEAMESTEETDKDDD